MGTTLTEADLRHATGLVAKHGRGRVNGASAEALFDIERELLTMNIRLDNPVGAPGPQTPDGGRTLAMREAA